MKIRRINLKHFRGFRGEYLIDLGDGKNLLVYGENGSGKSSLFHALDLFFAPPSSFAEQQNIFETTDEGFVKLDIGEGREASKTYEWEPTSHPYSEGLIAEASKTKGFLDYRALLETHFVHRQELSIDIFELLVRSLITNIRNPITNTPVGEEWNNIQQAATQRAGRQSKERLQQLRKDFSLGFANLLMDLAGNANEILRHFDQDIQIYLSLPSSVTAVNNSGNSVGGYQTALSVEYHGSLIPRHHHFLNEARLTAIAISIYLGALRLNPTSSLQVLFLDDVLIGLDMSNRLPLLDVLSQYFHAWQIILTTFDQVWFEMVRERVKAERASWLWEYAKFYCVRSDECDYPVYAPQNDYLEQADQYIANNDYKAAAIYIRSAYELAIKHYCSQARCLVQYCENPKDQKSEHFWVVTRNGLDSTIVRDIELYRSTVLNRLSHTEPVTLVRGEIIRSRDAVSALKQELDRLLLERKKRRAAEPETSL
jgi:energy-coupling factor transporter ATP-binding protein EcfA2